MNYKEEVRDLFSVPEEYYLAHSISADFALGAGIALEFNRRFDMRDKLRAWCPGYVRHYRYDHLSGDCILIDNVLNLVTKERCYYKPRLTNMEIALRGMRDICIEQKISKIAMPMIGAGLDKLPWDKVSELIKQIFSDTDIEILVCKLK